MQPEIMPHAGHIIKNTGNAEILIQETEASCNVDDSEVNCREGKDFFARDFLMPPLFSHCPLPLTPFRFRQSGLKQEAKCYPKPGLQDGKQKVYLHHFTCKQSNVGMLCIVGAPGHSTEFLFQIVQGIHLKNQTELLR